jgi:hypothetical protein
MPGPGPGKRLATEARNGQNSLVYPLIGTVSIEFQAWEVEEVPISQPGKIGMEAWSSEVME